MKSESIVVFKKNITDEAAENWMKSINVTYRKGMDSSRGKIYFYSTGPKYIIKFTDEAQKQSFNMEHYDFLPEIHEIYTADWDKAKD